MKALYWDGGRLSLKTDHPLPVCNENESLVEVTLAAVCNTDKEVARGYRAFRGVLGHEFVGVVKESPQKELVGKRVVGELNTGCGYCDYCRRGLEKHCKSRTALGIHGADGTFAEYVKVTTKNLHVLPDSLPDEQAIYIEPLAAAIQVQRQARISPADSVAVLGAGRLGYMIAQVLSLTGCDLTVVDLDPNKLKQAARFAKTATDTNQEFDFVIDATGSPKGISACRKLVKNAGTVVVKSTYAGTVELDLSDFVVNEITIMGSRCGKFEPAINLLSRGLLDFPKIELHPLEAYERAFSSTAFKAGFRIKESK